MPAAPNSLPLLSHCTPRLSYSLPDVLRLALPLLVLLSCVPRTERSFERAQREAEPASSPAPARRRPVHVAVEIPAPSPASTSVVDAGDEVLEPEGSEPETSAEGEQRRRKNERAHALFKLRYLRPAERVYELQLCRWDTARPLPECDDLADLLVESAEPDAAEQRKLRALDERWKRVRPARPAPPSEPKVYACRDGTLSGCPCPGPKGGCCSHHGGVVGCR